jgi:hypothetical protein
LFQLDEPQRTLRQVRLLMGALLKHLVDVIVRVRDELRYAGGLSPSARRCPS